MGRSLFVLFSWSDEQHVGTFQLPHPIRPMSDPDLNLFMTVNLRDSVTELLTDPVMAPLLEWSEGRHVSLGKRRGKVKDGRLVQMDEGRRPLYEPEYEAFVDSPLAILMREFQTWKTEVRGLREQLRKKERGFGHLVEDDPPSETQP